MSEATLSRVHRPERRPLGAIIWFAWMLAMWAGLLALLVTDRIDPVWNWVRDLSLLVEVVVWVTLFPWLLGAAVWTSSWAGWLRLLLVLVLAFGGSLAAIPRRKQEQEGGRVMSDRQVLRGLADVAVASPLFAFAPLYRRRHLRWGATDAEVAGAMPGDELVSNASFNATRAITISAPPEAVWPWLVQLGYGRAGFYSYDLFDNAARPSAERIVPEHQEPKVGDWVPMARTVNETTAFKIKTLEPNRWMLWAKPHSAWAWKLVPLEGERTRLIARLKERYEWRASPGNALLTLILFEFGDFPMMRRLLLGVKRRAERLATSEPGSPLHSADVVSAG